MTIQKIEIKQRCYTKSGPKILHASMQNPGDSCSLRTNAAQPMSDYVTLDIMVGAETHRIKVSSRIGDTETGDEEIFVEWYKV